MNREQQKRLMSITDALVPILFHMDDPPYECNPTDVERLQAELDLAKVEVSRLEAELADTRAAIKCILSRCDNTPWQSVPESEVDSHVQFVREQRAAGVKEAAREM